jgi:hypothetical protein
MQISIFDLPINSTIAELPTAIIKPKEEPVLQPVTALAPRASPEFAIGAIAQSPKYFKNLNGEIIGFEQFGGIDFAILRYQWYDSVIDYPEIASSLTSIGKTPLLEVSLPVDNTQTTVDNPQPLVENQQLRIGDRVKVLDHQFMRDRIGEIQDLHPNGKQAIVNFGATENIWLISIRSLQNV